MYAKVPEGAGQVPEGREGAETEAGRKVWSILPSSSPARNSKRAYWVAFKSAQIDSLSLGVNPPVWRKEGGDHRTRGHEGVRRWFEDGAPRLISSTRGLSGRDDKSPFSLFKEEENTVAILHDDALWPSGPLADGSGRQGFQRRSPVSALRAAATGP